jgi:uncharacterized protein YaaR (DUF327 family)
LSEEAAAGEITTVGTEEATSATATSIGQFFALVRRFIDYVLKVAYRLWSMISQHPEAALLTVANMCIIFG